MFAANSAASARPPPWRHAIPSFQESPMQDQPGQVVPISLVSVAMSKLTGRPAPGYRALWRLIVDGQISGIRRNGRWFLDVPQAVVELGLAKAPTAEIVKPV
jgi:hypothetical protein